MWLSGGARAAMRVVSSGEQTLMLRETTPVEIDEKLDLVAFVDLFRNYRTTILLSTLILGAAATVFAFVATPMYRAEVTLTIVKEKEEGPGSELGGSLSDIANLAGVNIGQSADEDADKAVLSSRHLIQVFIERYGLLPTLHSPTLWKAVNHFHDDLVYIKDDQRKGTTVVAITWTDPAVAARWANDFVALCNELIRTRALNEAQRNVAYLTEQAARTTSVDVQHALYNLVESETKKLMMANERIEYAFAVADPAVAPEIRSSPKRTMLLMGGLGLGMFIGFSIAFVRARLAVRRPRALPPT
jgi:uncharacterized protein involved in exopolysaccharide biosynthesis